MNIKWENLKNEWKNLDIKKIRFDLKIEKLNMGSSWEYDKPTRLMLNLNNMGRYCTHVPQKLLEKYNDNIEINVKVSYQDKLLETSSKLANVEDVEIIFQGLEEKILEKMGSALPNEKNPPKEEKNVPAQELDDSFLEDLF